MTDGEREACKRTIFSPREEVSTLGLCVAGSVAHSAAFSRLLRCQRSSGTLTGADDNRGWRVCSTDLAWVLAALKLSAQLRL